MGKATKTIRATAKSRPHKSALAGADTRSRSYLKQSDVPGASLEDALRIPEALFENYAGRASTPMRVAQALNIAPNGRQLQGLSGASIAFGLIEGGAQAASIAPTELARKIIRPRSEDEDKAARREAVLKPRVFGEFLRQYDSHPFPRSDIALNVLESLGVPRPKTRDVLQRIEDSARSVGFIEQINGKYYVTLAGVDEVNSDGGDDAASTTVAFDEILNNEPNGTGRRPEQAAGTEQKTLVAATAIAEDQRRRKVFITHGKNRAMVDTIKRMLEYGELEPIVSVERESVSKPVPEKVMGDMRGAGAAIIHVDADQTVTDSAGEKHVILNPNVLIEIGAAMAFYGRRFILLVRDGVTLPSNLQGLYQVRYEGDTLAAEPALKLLEAMKDIKNHELPSSYAV